MSDLSGQDFSDSPVSIELAARACRKEATCVSHTPRCVFSIQFVYSPGITQHNSAKLDSCLDVLMFGLGGDFFIHENRLSALGKDQYLPPGSSGNKNIFAVDAGAQPVHGHLGLSECISKLEFICVYPSKPDPPWVHAGITAPAPWAASRPGDG